VRIIVTSLAIEHNSYTRNTMLTHARKHMELMMDGRVVWLKKTDTERMQTHDEYLPHSKILDIVGFL
jgi:hypothetical protein